MKASDFDFELDEALIAQHPEESRDHSRLLVIGRKTGSLDHKHFYDLVDELDPGDLVVMNDSKVIPARLFGTRPGKEESIEVLLLQPLGDDVWDCLVKPGRKMRPGAEVVFGPGFSAKVLDMTPDGNRHVRLFYEDDLDATLDRFGQMPLPPYIKERLEDPDRYQTIYANERGSAAAPTAGLHFTQALFDRMAAKGINRAFVTLHVGLGTFRPMQTEEVEDHVMHSEYYTLPQETVDLIKETKARGGRVICVGTTCVRTLEASYQKNQSLRQDSGWTNIFIYPGFEFQVADGLVTNFHLPKSTLMMLVSAFASRDIIMEAYQEAMRNHYRFFSFGDACFIKPEDL